MHIDWTSFQINSKLSRENNILYLNNLFTI
jgi:hypothetical protein